MFLEYPGLSSRTQHPVGSGAVVQCPSWEIFLPAPHFMLPPSHFSSLVLDPAVNQENSAALQNPTEQKNTDYFLLQELLLSVTADLGAQDCTGPGEQEQEGKFLSFWNSSPSRSSFPSACELWNSGIQYVGVFCPSMCWELCWGDSPVTDTQKKGENVNDKNNN